MPKRNPKKQQFPLLILVLGGILLLVSAIWFFLQITAEPVPAAPPARDEESLPDIARVSIADARAALDSGSAILVDVRIADAYNAQRIPGALNIPEAEVASRLNELDPNQWIITYCT